MEVIKTRNYVRRFQWRKSGVAKGVENGPDNKSFVPKNLSGAVLSRDIKSQRV